MAATPAAPVIVEPKLDIHWGDFHQGTASSLRTLLTGPFHVRKSLGGDYFRDCWVERRLPWRAVVAAALWHVVFVLSPFSLLPTTVRHNPAFDNAQLTWSGPIKDFPALEILAAKPKTISHTDPTKPLPPKGADAFHPRQRIVTDPVHPNHPRQTLIRPNAPQIAPKTLPDMPNIVQLEAAAPPRPRLQISEEALAKLHPRQHRVAASPIAPPPDAPLLEQKPADLMIAVSPNAPARPKLELNAGAAPRVAPRAQTGDSLPAPELGAAQSPDANGSPASLIALSAAPAAPKPDVQPPQGNLAARISIAPEGTKRGVSDGSPSTPADLAGGARAAASSNGGGKSPVGISISGGNPQPKNDISGAGGAKLSLPSTRTLINRPEPKTEDSPERTGPPNFAILPPGAKPEQVFAAKRVYTLSVNMANLNSASGSWILHFAELGSVPGAAPLASAELAMPVPVRKVDPKYPPDLIEQNVQGEVILYGIVHANGSVDSLQVARSLDPQLDANAKSAFAQWKFQPASKAGTPVDLEVIAHIPFKIRDDR
jgi:TonB family protein